MGPLHEDRYMFLILSRSLFLRMIKLSDKRRRAKQNTYFI